MREQKYHIYLNKEEYDRVIHSLISRECPKVCVNLQTDVR